MDPQAPPVVAVVVTAEPGDWLEETLGGLAVQDYPNLSVLVIDAGSSLDPTPRIAAALPGAFVRRLEHPTGYAAAANEVLQAVDGASFFLMCHDDVALDPDAVRLLVEEAFRSNAGLVAPKLVAWEDPARLLQVGMTADKGGVPVPLAHSGEMDQEQHDGVRDVFVAPGGAFLVRADLFEALGGFDAGMILFGEDLDLCWRAQVAGARIIVAPAARARHLAASSSGMRRLQELPGLPQGSAPQLVLRRRHELRAALKAYSVWHLVRVLPQLAAHSVAEVAVGLATGHPAAARASASAWIWNLRRAGELGRLRRQVAVLRTLPDSEVRRLQSGGSARLAGLAEALFARAAARVPHMGSDAQADAAVGQDRPWWPVAIGGLIVAFLLVGSRGQLHAGPPAVGQMLPFGSTGHLLGSFASSVRGTGLGRLSPAPLGLALAGVTSLVLGGSSGLAQTVLVVGMLPLGAWGAYRLARPLGSVRARLLAPVVYLAVPLPYAALTEGRWADLVAYAAAPWLLGLLAGATGLAPFSSAGPPLWWRWVSTSLVLALAGAAAPGLALAAVLAGLGLVLASLLTGDTKRSVRALVTSVVGAAGAWLLAFPWSASLTSPGAQVQAVLGVRPLGSRGAGVGAILGFHPEPGGSNWVGWALLVGMSVPLLFGREWRLGWGARLWSVAALCWLVAWAGGRGWLGPVVLEPGLLLAVGGVALALSAALGVVAFEQDLVGFGLGWRQLMLVVGIVGLGFGVLGALGHAGDGRWGAPVNDFRSVLAAVPGHSRTGAFEDLWVGDPRALPGAGWELYSGVSYATAPGGSLPDVTFDWPPPTPGRAAPAAAALLSAESGRTGEVGRRLGALGIRYVLVPTSDAPGGPALAPPPALVQALEDQLDLRALSVDPSLLVFQNVDWSSRRPAPAPPRARGLPRAADLTLETALWVLAVGALVLGRSRRSRRERP